MFVPMLADNARRVSVAMVSPLKALASYQLDNVIGSVRKFVDHLQFPDIETLPDGTMQVIQYYRY